MFNKNNNKLNVLQAHNLQYTHLQQIRLKIFKLFTADKTLYIYKKTILFLKTNHV